MLRKGLRERHPPLFPMSPRTTCDRLRARRRGTAASPSRATQSRSPANRSPIPAMRTHPAGSG